MDVWITDVLRRDLLKVPERPAGDRLMELAEGALRPVFLKPEEKSEHSKGEDCRRSDRPAWDLWTTLHRRERTVPVVDTCVGTRKSRRTRKGAAAEGGKSPYFFLAVEVLVAAFDSFAS